MLESYEVVRNLAALLRHPVRPRPRACHAQADRNGSAAGRKCRFDHFAIDAKGQRLFVAALGNNTLEVIDLARGIISGASPDCTSRLAYST